MFKVYGDAKDVSWESVIIIEVQLVAKIQTITIDVNVVDVNVTTRSKAFEGQVFKDKEPRKTKNATNWEK